MAGPPGRFTGRRRRHAAEAEPRALGLMPAVGRPGCERRGPRAAIKCDANDANRPGWIHGLSPYWAKRRYGRRVTPPGIATSCINDRGETVAEKPAFRS